MKKNRLWIIIATVVVIAIVIRILFFSKDSEAPQATAGKWRGGPVGVAGVVATGSDLDEVIVAGGSILANEEVILRPEISGRIIKLNIKEGAAVKKGELLVKINDSDLQAQLRKLNGELKLIEERSLRQKALFEMNGISKQDYDDVLNQINSLKADQDYTRSQIEKTEIRAPFSGQVGLRYVSEGGAVTPADLIATVRQINPVKIDFSVPEKYSAFIKSGDSIRFTVDGTSDFYTGKIYAVEPGIEAATRTFRIRAISDNTAGTLYPGAFAKIEMLLKKNASALMIPTQAIIPVLKGKKVFVVKDGKAYSRPVESGIRNSSSIEIIKGINTGDTVITTGIMQLRDSMPVKVTITENL